MSEPTRPEDIRPETTVEEPLFSVEQWRRIEALRVAKELRPQSVGAMFGSTPIEPSSYVTDLEILAEYIIDGVREAEVEYATGPQLQGVAINLADAPEALRDRVFGSIREHIARVEAETEKAKNPDSETPSEDTAPIATASEITRHAQKQDVSYSDAWNYLRDQGYVMTEDVADFEFDPTNPNAGEVEPDDLPTVDTTKFDGGKA